MSKKKAAAVFFDIKAAFDSVPHASLLSKLQDRFHVPIWLLRWLRSYLSNRYYSVVVDGHTSARRLVPSGVPQGSVLGPVLFSAYLDEVAAVKVSAGAQVFCFADDLVLLKPLKSTSAERELQGDVDTVHAVVSSLQLRLNSSKTKSMVFGLHARPPLLSSPLHLNGQAVDAVFEHLYLGVLFDRRLNFGRQTQQACLRARRAVGALQRCFGFAAPLRVLSLVYSSCVLSSLLYAIVVWLPRAQCHRLRIEKVQRLFLRNISNQYTLTYSQLLSLPNCARHSTSLVELALRRRLCYYHKCFHRLKVFPSGAIEQVERRRGRRSGHDCSVVVPRARVDAFDASPYVFTAAIWNALPTSYPELSPARFNAAITSEFLSAYFELLM